MTFQTTLDAVKNNTCHEINFHGGFFYGTSFTLPEFGELFAALANNRSVTKVDVQRNNIGDAEAKVLAEALKVNKTVTHINLEWNKISYRGAKYLAEALASSCSINHIDLSYNNILSKGAEYFAKALKTNYSVRSVNLKDISMTPDGVEALAEVFNVNCSLTTLMIERDFPQRDSSVDEQAIDFLLQNLRGNYALTNLEIRIDRSNQNFLEIQKVLERNHKLRKESHRAAKDGRWDILENCLVKGVSLLSVAGEEENTLLHWAAASGYEKMVRELLKRYQAHKLIVHNIRNKLGKTPIDLARDSNRLDIVQILSNVDSVLPHNKQEREEQFKHELNKFKEKKSRVHQLEKERNELQLKLSMSSVNEKDYEDIKKSLEEAQKKLEEAKAQAEEEKSQLTSQLKEYKEKLEKLENKKEKTVAKLNAMWEPLFDAVDDKDERTIAAILDSGYNVNSIASGNTVLYRAVETSSKEIIKLLIESKADPNRPSNFSYETPFHRAVRRALNGDLDVSVILLLIEAGAEIGIPMTDGTKLLDFIRDKIIALEAKQKVVQGIGLDSSKNILEKDEAEKELPKIQSDLQNHKKIEKWLKDTNEKQEVKTILENTERSIKKQLDALEEKYRTPIDLLKRDPDKLKHSLNIFSEYFKGLKTEHMEAMEILNSSKNASLRRLPEKELNRMRMKIDAFFDEWEPKLQKADAEIKTKFPSSSSSSVSALSSTRST